MHGPSSSNITDAHTCHTHDIHNQPVLQDTTVSVEWYEYDPTIRGHLESVLGCKCYICSSLLKRHGQQAVTRRILMSPQSTCYEPRHVMKRRTYMRSCPEETHSLSCERSRFKGVGLVVMADRQDWKRHSISTFHLHEDDVMEANTYRM